MQSGTTAQLSEEEVYVAERNKPMPSLNHSIVQGNIVFQLKLNYRTKFRITSELSFDLKGWVSTPDVSLLTPSEYDANNDIIKVTEPPLGVVEILSPTQTLTDLMVKMHQYFAHGVKSVWIGLPPLENIYVFSSATEYEIYRNGETLKDAALEIELPVAEIFTA